MTEPDYKQVCAELQSHCQSLREALAGLVEGESANEAVLALLKKKPPFYNDLPLPQLRQAQWETYRELDRQHAADLMEIMARHGFGDGQTPRLQHSDAEHPEGDALSFDGIMVFVLPTFIEFLKKGKS